MHPCRSPLPWLVAGALLAAAAPLAAGAVRAVPSPQPSVVEVAPGIGYQRRVEASGPVHVLRVRRTGLAAVEPLLTGGATSRRGDLTAAVASRSAAGVVGGVNADYFNFGAAYPSGVTVTSALGLVSEPEPTRSALLLGPGGVLSAGRLTLTGRWQTLTAGGGPLGLQRTFSGVNRPAERSSETLVYTPAAGAATPGGTGRTEALVAADGAGVLVPNAPLTGTVRSVRAAGGTPLAPGTVVVAGVGSAGNAVRADLTPGTRVRLDPVVAGLPAGAEAVGGGPLLVDAGTAVLDAGEGFSGSQTRGRTARTAVGQTADGTVLLVFAEGPQQGRRGVTAAEQAILMDRLGSRIAVAMDSGGSAQMAVDATPILPATGLRPIQTALVARYGGVRVAPLPARVTPNGDGVDDTAEARVTVPQPGRLVVRLVRRGGGDTRVLVDEAAAAAGERRLALNPAALRLPDGPYRLEAELTPLAAAPATVAGRTMVVDRTLAALSVRPTLRRRPGRVDAAVLVRFRLLRPARVTVTVRDGTGRLRRTLRAAKGLPRGTAVLRWDRRVGRRYAVGEQRIQVEARTSLGTPGLVAGVRLKPVPAPRRPPARRR